MALAPEPQGGTPLDGLIVGGLAASIMLLCGWIGFIIGLAAR